MQSINDLKAKARACRSRQQTEANIKQADEWHSHQELHEEARQMVLTRLCYANGRPEADGWLDPAEIEPALRIVEFDVFNNRAIEKPLYRGRIDFLLVFPGHKPIGASCLVAWGCGYVTEFCNDGQYDKWKVYKGIVNHGVDRVSTSQNLALALLQAEIGEIKL